LAVELNPRLAALLGRRRPGLDVAVAGAAQLPEMLAERGLDRADVVVSGLPWAAYPVTGPRLTDVVAGCLRPDGAFTQFTYVWSRWAPPARRQHRWLRDAFEEVVGSRTVWANLPPALVHLARRPRGTPTAGGARTASGAS
jgi:phospholipid N-methyltransferase